VFNPSDPDKPKSDRIYYTDSYVQEFSARVVRVIDDFSSPGVVLESTAFYPESGGQPSDRGELGGRQIVDVVETEAGIVHLLAGETPAVGAEIRGRIDWNRRFDHMQQHTGQHILSQAFIGVLGSSTQGFHMGELVSTVDLDVESVSPEKIREAEARANQVVFEDRKIAVRFVDSSDQDGAGLRKPSERSGRLRIIEIEGYDRSACGGTHCGRTGEVGLIKVRRQERVRQKARIEFVCGFRALADYQNKNDAASAAAQLLSVSDQDLQGAVERHLEQHKSLRKELSRAREQLLEFQATQAVALAEQFGDRDIVSGVWDGLDMGQLNRLASLVLVDSPRRIALLAGRGPQSFLLFARSRDLASVDLRPVMAQAAAAAEGRGGGSADRCQAGACNADLLDRAIALALKEVGVGKEGNGD
jgi:alanyl-tRNA synthetase